PATRARQFSGGAEPSKLERAAPVIAKVAPGADSSYFFGAAASGPRSRRQLDFDGGARAARPLQALGAARHGHQSGFVRERGEVVDERRQHQEFNPRSVTERRTFAQVPRQHAVLVNASEKLRI